MLIKNEFLVCHKFNYLFNLFIKGKRLIPKI